MTIIELENLEKFVNYLSKQLDKSNWREVGSSEWKELGEDVKRAIDKRYKDKIEKGQKIKIGESYIYEHLIINKLKVWKANKPLDSIRSLSYRKLNLIARAYDFNNYIDLIKRSEQKNNFNELKIDVDPVIAQINLRLLKNLVGNWYSYNRNLPYSMGQTGEERIWRSSVVIKKEGEDFLVERSGKDGHKYYGRVNAYGDYVFIIMNSNTFIRQRHFISRIKDISVQLKSSPNYEIPLLSLVSTCISFNGEPIALYEIFERQGDEENFSNATIDLPVDSPEIPQHILTHLRDIGRNRITQH